MTLLPPVDEMIRAYQGSDTTYDGIFYVAVCTTGIFCLPSCPARKPFPRNVEFFASPAECLAAGYRPCKRCKPTEAPDRAPEWAAALIAEVERDPSARIKDDDLRARGLEPATVRRYFLKQHGMTFQVYARTRRLGEAFSALQSGADLDDVALGYGYESHSGFREAFGRLFGNAPGGARDGDCVVTELIESPVGSLVAGANKDGVCLLEFPDEMRVRAQIDALKRQIDAPIVPGHNAHLDHLRAELGEYFAGKRTTFAVPLVVAGTPFQRRVWDALHTIPYGETRSYSQLAANLGDPQARRAVGSANGKNRIAILIPCHRVVDASGGMGGYGGGVWRKKLLLELEQGKAI
ncbi:MAG: methylated-DNA--[protein]-cysteine S-methyltransferase [Chloroflexota bacterium]|nr:methylated-DNA--[protein]-cysteine S-methyltransferase [Chloroflexota bacterium]